ncbi:hypothetical protein H6P81_012237 [Aristolochia fimbriata]|uniref:Uncharacterized protein n=1 Tax=Aristolochia fimbriata TaxID=158543 RepID=A0AAV7ECV5_ARIFI|nr:hypothetical protein H6P81_012237 [Aristolochia fimbriata]
MTPDSSPDSRIARSASRHARSRFEAVTVCSFQIRSRDGLLVPDSKPTEFLKLRFNCGLVRNSQIRSCSKDFTGICDLRVRIRHQEDHCNSLETIAEYSG